ncbi:molybdopterin guanine dinucleotide biosynthesis protein MoaE [Thalassotalea loyana]|uniref:Molybdopterin synthase catalytic subunit n=1 Tax=Thalassotalea loyana TaxID=280483 RepID=A0ABQ6HET5_9GAMM|nr:molybdopterin synthase catalytic subunit MoaE [Thalassotalea loyana]GLX85247.1 molybdopterin guanine dinucleotide biosynthesis protein MoaE [Thalassotalea loyana]
MIRVQTQDFDQAHEYRLLTENTDTDGAIVTFVGKVRNNNLGEHVQGLCLEHYPQMTEKALRDIVSQAKTRWELGSVTVIHRVGELKIGDQIVYVGVTSKHRKNAFEACEFIIDYLKVSAPFWKKELTNTGEKWLEARESDEQQANTW